MDEMTVLARSKAGHDKNHVYLIWSEDETYVYLVNGTTRTKEHPKKKKKMHIQIIRNLPDDITELPVSRDAWTNESIAEMLELYHRRKENVESGCY